MQPIKLKTTRKIVDVKDIVLNQKIYPREYVNKMVANSYKTKLEAGEIFPLIAVVERKGKYEIIDGAHRVEMYKLAKQKQVEVEVYPTMTDTDLLKLAIQLNVKHGYQFTPSDITRCILRLQKLGVGKHEICALVEIPSNKIDNYLEKRTLTLVNALTGKPYTDVLKYPLRHLGQASNVATKRTTEVDVEDEGSDDAPNLKAYDSTKVGGSSQKRLIDELCYIIENRLVQRTKPVITALKELRVLLNAYFTKK